MTNIRIENNDSAKIVNLNFKGNIDVAIKCMKKDPYLHLSEKQKLQLKCCLLFLYGMSVSKISQQLKIDQTLILKYLNDPDLESILSFEYNVLFHLNKKRLESKEQEFHDIDEKNLQKQIEQLNPQNIIQDRYLKLCRAILIENISDIKELESYTGISQKNMRELLMKPSANIQVLPKEIFQILIKNIFLKFPEIIIEKKQTTSNKTRIVQKYLSNEALMNGRNQYLVELYESGRYSLPEFSELIGLDNAGRVLLKTALEENEKTKLMEHKKEVKSLLLKSSRSKTTVLVKDPNMIKMLKPNMKIIQQSDHKLLKLVLNYLKIFEEITQKDPDFPLVDMETVLIVHQYKLKELLEPSIFLKLWQCLEIEQLLFGNEMKKKKEYIVSVVELFFVHDLSLEETAQLLEIPVEILIRILQHDFIKTQYGIIVYEYLKKAITNYRLEREKEIGHSYFLS